MKVVILFFLMSTLFFGKTIINAQNTDKVVPKLMIYETNNGKTIKEKLLGERFSVVITISGRVTLIFSKKEGDLVKSPVEYWYGDSDNNFLSRGVNETVFALLRFGDRIIEDKSENINYPIGEMPKEAKYLNIIVHCEECGDNKRLESKIKINK
jgi:hypothetical protein